MTPEPSAASRPPAFAAPSDPSRLLAAVADALNRCERHGLVVDLERDGVITSQGYILPVGDARLGTRWAVRARLPAPELCVDTGGDLAAEDVRLVPLGPHRVMRLP